MESDVSSYNLSKQIEGLDVDTINVGINSYGGEIGEGLAIYNALKRSKAKVRTRCDGFACSIASVIFMAGDERVMSDPSMLMIHNGWTSATGDAKALRKQADDIEKMTEASISIYKQAVSIEEDELRSLMDAETWLGPDEAVEMGFATSVESSDESKPSQSVKRKVMQMLRNPYRMAEEDEEDTTEEPTDDGGAEDGQTDDATDDTTEDAPETTGEEEPGGDSTDDPEPDPESDPDEDHDDEDPDRPTTPAAQMMRLLHAIQHM